MKVYVAMGYPCENSSPADPVLIGLYTTKAKAITAAKQYCSAIAYDKGYAPKKRSNCTIAEDAEVGLTEVGLHINTILYGYKNSTLDLRVSVYAEEVV